MENIKRPETSKTIFRNVIYGLSTWVLPFLLSFFATRVIVKSLGLNDYGIYSLVLGFIGFSFNFNFGRAITKYIAEYRAADEVENISDVISTTFFINFVVAVVGVAGILIFTKFLVADVFQIPEINQAKTITALNIAAVIILFLMLNQLFNSVLQGIHRFDIYSNIFNINTVVMLAGNILLVLGGGGLIELLLWNLIVTAVTCFPAAIYAKRLVPELKIKLRIKPEIFKMVALYSGGIIGYQLLGNIVLLFERGWIIRQLGEKSLTYYVVPMMLALYIHAFICSIVLVVFPLASELKNNPEKLLRLYSKATKTVCFFVFFMATTLIIESKLFLTLWLGAEFAENAYLLLVIHTLTFSLVAVQTVSWQVTEGLGHPGYNFRVFFICFLINMAGIFIFTQTYGTVGVAGSRLAGFCTVFFSICYVEKWFFQRVQTVFWLKLIGTLGVACFFSAVAENLIIEHLHAGWLNFFLSAFGGGIVYCFTLWLSGFVTDDEKLLVRNFLNL